MVTLLLHFTFPSSYFRYITSHKTCARSHSPRFPKTLLVNSSSDSVKKMYTLIRSRYRFISILNSGIRRSFSSAADAEPQPSENKAWRFVMYGILAALTGGVATVGYFTHAYPLEEIEERTKAFRASANCTIKESEDNSASASYKSHGYLPTAAVPILAKLIDHYIDLRRLAEEHIRGYTEPISDKLLPDLHPIDVENNVFTIVLDLKETLVFSDWKRDRGWRTFKRPGVDDFLEFLGQYYEIVVYSDEPIMFVNPVIERLDTKNCIGHWLSRSATKYVNGKYYRDLSKPNRDPAKVIYISGHALESSLQPENSVEINPWKGEADDTALLDLIPFLEYVAIHTPADVRTVIASYQGGDIAKQFIQRSKELGRSDLTMAHARTEAAGSLLVETLRFTNEERKQVNDYFSN